MSRKKTKVPERRGRGRPTVRTPETAEIICDAVARGMPFRLACHVAKISPTTFNEWKAEDATFAEQLEEAIARGVDVRLRTIEEASHGDWRAASWLLEHCLPEHFAKSRIQVEAVGQFDHAFVIPQETLNQIAEARAKHERELSGNGSVALALPEPRPQAGK